MEPFSLPTKTWFQESFERPTKVQELGWEQIAAGRHSLLLAPTGSGKTLAAFLWGIDRVSRLEAHAAPGVRVLYVSPLKALVYDIERNLSAPLVGIQRMAERLDSAVRRPRVDVRTGDTPQKERVRQRRDPAEILVTTPESLFLILGSQAREALRTVHTVIIDEVHSLAPTKRGAHLALTLERLAANCEQEPQRIGLSATARPASEIAKFLVGQRDVAVVDASDSPNVELTVAVPVPDMERVRHEQSESTASGSILGQLAAKGSSPSDKKFGLWPAIYPELLQLVQQHRSTILFANSRGLCERLALKLNELAGEEVARAHHGSVSHEQRRTIEEALKLGHCRAIVATSSLELGIDMGAIDLVVLVESPGSVARGLQRVGRAGHQVGAASKGVLVPKFRGDLLECAVLSLRMASGEIESTRVPQNALDVLAQQIAAIVSDNPCTVDELEALVHRSYPYQELGRASLVSVLDMLSGRFPSDDFAELRPRIAWDRTQDVLAPRRGTAMLVRLNAGTIPDRGLYGVHLGHDGPRIGELDEEMTYESRTGDVILLGASSWRILEITRDRVVVEPAPGEPGRLPFWRGDGPGRPLELGRAIGAFVREVGSRPQEEAASWLHEQTALDDYAVQNLVDYVFEQKRETEALPTDRRISVETFRDELGDWRVCILTPFGSRIHAPWAMALQTTLAAKTGYDTPTMWSDDGIVLTFADGDALPELDVLFPDPDDLEDLVVEQLSRSALFGATFRENAGRSLLLPKRRPQSRSPLWAQRLKAKNLLGTVQRFPDFPIVLETYRQCMRDVFDLPALGELLRDIRSRSIGVDAFETVRASPFARSLVFSYVAAYLYEQDAPLAERRAQALTLDRGLLRELLGQGELRELVDPAVLERIEQELQCLTEDRKARDADELHDLLRKLGALDEHAIYARCDAPDDVAAWLSELEGQRRAVRVRRDKQELWIAAQDAGLYRDALGIAPPTGLPDAFLADVHDALDLVIRRHARTHGPFTTGDLATLLALRPVQVESRLAELERGGFVVRGEFRPRGSEIEWCDEEVFRRIKRETLAKLRGQVAAVDAAAYARFLPRWHGVAATPIPRPDAPRAPRFATSPRREGPGRLLEVIAQLEGLALPHSTWLQDVLPARVDAFTPELLDGLSSSGQLVWVGAGALGARDGRVAIYRRESARLLVKPVERPESLQPLHTAILDVLDKRGAMFTHSLEGAARSAEPSASVADFESALLDLAWLGLVTNDTFQPLRTRSKRTQRRGRAAHVLAGGRWSRVAELCDASVAATERAHALATSLLERHGVVSREAAYAEGLEGGFASVYPVLKAMEEAGRARRGWFVEGLGGAQFALAGAIDRLREARDGDVPEVFVLAANDPANAWGHGLPWPESTNPDVRPRRTAGARVILCGGLPVLWLAPSGKQLLTFRCTEARELRRDALVCLADMRGRPRVIEKIDGAVATTSELRDALREVGFVEDYKGLIYDETARRA